MTPKEKRNALLAEKLVGNLKQRHYEAFFCHTAQDRKSVCRERV